MVPIGQLIWREERGRETRELVYIRSLPLLVATVYAPPQMKVWRKTRRMNRVIRDYQRAGVRQVIWSERCPWRPGEAGFVPVALEGVYQAMADQLAMAALEQRGCAACEGCVALVGQRLSVPLQRTAERLCPRVRQLLIHVPKAGEDYARWLHRQYGLPVTPVAAGADVTVAFTPGGPRWGSSLELYGTCSIEGLDLAVRGLELPEDITAPVLATLWERGAVIREELEVVQGEVCP